MKAHLEILSGVIRAGEETDEYGKPFMYAVAFSSTDGKSVVLKGLVSRDKKPTSLRTRLAVMKAIKAALAKHGLEADWVRFKQGHK